MKKTKIIALIAVSFVVFATTFFALAEDKNSNSLFLDSDQDGLTDQEEKAIGTDPRKADTDGDGYSDGKEIESGYNPLKAAPGDKIVPQGSPAPATTSVQSSGIQKNTELSENSTTQNPTIDSTDLASSDLLSQIGQTDVLSADAITDLSSDPNNPNLTNEMIGQLMQLTKNKAETDTSFAENPTFSSDDLAQVTQGALETVDVAKDLPEVKDSELNILPEIKDKKLDEDELKAAQKAEIEKYLAQIAFILASNSPFPVEDPTKLQSQVANERANLITALTTNDKQKLDTYAAKAQTGIDQLKKMAVPYLLKDTHKSTLQLAIYALDLKDNMLLNASDPMKGLAAVSNLQAVAQKSIELQDDFSNILKEYGVDEIKFP